MSKIIVSVEATADLSEKMRAEYDIAVAPMEYIVDGEIVRTDDPNAMTSHQMYESMRLNKSTKTSQINREHAYEHLEKLLKEGNEVIHVSFSSALSGTCASFLSAAEELDRTYVGKIKIVDSLCASCGQGMLAVLTAKYAASGKTLDEVAEYCNETAKKINHIFVVENLKYLARGGRISKTAAFIGNAIQLKPVMRCNEEGKLVPFRKILSRKRSLSAQVEEVCKKFSGESQEVYVGHADCAEEAQNVCDRLKEKLGVSPQLLELGPVIGAHSGPGTIAVYFVADDRSVT